jgi:hypothetical protein
VKTGTGIKLKEFYGRWKVIRYDGRRTRVQKTGEEPGRVRYDDMWLLECRCGKQKSVCQDNLVRGKTRSCNCYKTDLSRQRMTTHGQSGTRLYRVWAEMVRRCTDRKNPRWHRYGGRGIKVCDRWLGPNGFMNFKRDVGERPLPGLIIDRRENNGDYEPGNVRWITTKENQRNRCNNINLTHAGLTMCLAAWAEHLGIPYGTLWTRWRRWGKAGVRHVLAHKIVCHLCDQTRRQGCVCDL